jgi:glucosamine-6-phosphate deaminase
VRLARASSAEEFDALAADAVIGLVRSNPALALTLPTGSTPAGLYRRLVEAHDRGRFSLDLATVFMLDEYLDLPSYPTGSFLEYLRSHLGAVLFNDSTTVRALAPSADPAVATAYDAALDAVGGLDLAVVGVGRNGHVGFNEPGSARAVRTHVAELAPETLEANFPAVAGDDRPRRAITMGLYDVARAGAVLMLVAGPHKAKVARQLLEGRVLADVPATQLLVHPDLTVVMDGSLID